MDWEHLADPYIMKVVFIPFFLIFSLHLKVDFSSWMEHQFLNPVFLYFVEAVYFRVEDQ